MPYALLQASTNQARAAPGQTKVSYVVQEAIVVIKDVFRKYPNKYESVIATLCENLESLEAPEVSFLGADQAGGRSLSSLLINNLSPAC
jgi:vesicle coat complex subunit